MPVVWVWTKDRVVVTRFRTNGWAEHVLVGVMSAATIVLLANHTGALIPFITTIREALA